MQLLKKIKRVFYREPDFVIGDEDDPYLRRWWIIPRNPLFNVYLHHFLKSDDDRALHDHPWPSLGMILKGNYIEHTPVDWNAWVNQGDRLTKTRIIKAFVPKYRGSRYIHRVELFTNPTFKDGQCAVRPVPVWTLFITGPKLRDWGFWCNWGFRPWQHFVSLRDKGNNIGRGCE